MMYKHGDIVRIKTGKHTGEEHKVGFVVVNPDGSIEINIDNFNIKGKLREDMGISGVTDLFKEFKDSVFTVGVNDVELVKASGAEPRGIEIKTEFGMFRFDINGVEIYGKVEIEEGEVFSAENMYRKAFDKAMSIIRELKE